MNELLILLVLLVFSAFFSAAETALTSLSKIKVSRLEEQKVPGAKIVKKLKDHPGDFLSTILIGNNFVNILASAIATSLIIEYAASRGWRNIGLAIGTATGVLTFVILTFCEIIPKTVALRKAEKFALFSAPMVAVIAVIIKPLAYLIGFISRPFIVLFGGKAPEQGPFVTEDEIRLILAAGEKEGVIEEGERQMITSIFEFGDTVAREVMTPRPDITACDLSLSLEEIKQIILDSGHSRIPVYEGNLDNIVGVVFAKDLLEAQEPAEIRELLRAVTFIPETKNVADLLHEMQAARTHLVIIVDEHGVASGLVTLEDLIEEIVGEIHDEFERDEKTLLKIDDQTMVIDGRLSINDANSELHLNLPVDDYDTVGGFVFGLLGKMPFVGAAVRYEDLRLTVERIHRRRVTRIKIEKIPGQSEDEAVGG